VLADLLVHGLAVGAALDGALQLRGVGADPLETVAAAGALPLMGEVGEALDRLGRAVGQLRLDLADLLIRFREELPLQLVELEVDHRAVRLHAMCRLVVSS